MAEVHYTEEQKRIIEHEGNNLLVSASAGSGKTMVLIEHILFLIQEKKVSLDQLLVVTFTNDAANEMKQRLKALLQKAIQKEEHKEQKSVEVMVAFDPSKDAEENIKNKLKIKYGDDANIFFSKDPQMMGGLSIKIGDEMLDLSVKGKIKKLVNQLTF